MKKFIIAGLAAGLLFIPYIPVCQPWKLVFTDGFEGNELDQNHWQYGHEWHTNVWSNDAVEYMTKNNIEVGDGKLKITFNHEPGCYDLWVVYNCSPCNPSCNITSMTNVASCGATTCKKELWAGPNGCVCTTPYSFDWTSGQVIGYKKIVIDNQGNQIRTEFGPYGKFEIRAYIPYFNNMNNAFWLYGSDCDYEIDVFETDCYDHWPMAVRGKNNCQDRRDDITHCYQNNTNAWHTWALEWTPDKIVWLLDGKIMKECASSGQFACKGEQYGVFLPFFPITTMDLRIGIGFSNACVIPHAPPDPPTPTPLTMEVDYVKVWELEEDNYAGACSPWPYDNWDIAIMNTTISSGNKELHAKRSITTNMVIPANTNLTLTAGRFIEIQPGFETDDNNVTFLAEIADCETAGEYEIECGICPPGLASTNCPNYKKPHEAPKDSGSVTGEDNVPSVDEEKIFEKEDGTTLIISPNPTSGAATIWFTPTTANAANATLELTDATGKTVFRKNNFVAGVVNYINLSALSKGIYFLKVYSDEQAQVEKIVLK